MRIPQYLPCWPCPTASQFSFGRGSAGSDASGTSMPFPLSSPNRKHFYVARNGIYHLFRSLGLRKTDNVLVPAYHSGNETAAMRAAGVAMRFYPIQPDLQIDREAVERLCTPE